MTRWTPTADGDRGGDGTGTGSGCDGEGDEKRDLCALLHVQPNPARSIVAPQIGYASIGYGAHGPGFLMANVASFTLQGLAVLAADKAMGLGWYDKAAALGNEYSAMLPKMEL